jgi:hypothetical protein
LPGVSARRGSGASGHGDGDTDRLPLFDDRLQEYLWDYDNRGLRIAQLRFYECSTTVPDATDPFGAQDDSDCF